MLSIASFYALYFSAAVATVIGPLAVAYGHATAESTLLPIILEMMHDEFHDVRLK